MADVPISLYTSVVKLTGENVAPPSLPPSLEETQPAINPPGTSDISGLVPYNGAIDNVNLGEKGLSTGFVQYDTTPTDTPTGSGTVVWNPDKYTLDLSMGLGDSVQQIGMETYYTPVKNQTGSLIPDGTFVMATGSLGASGRITVAPAVTDGSVDSRYMLGVTTHDIANGGDGLVTWFGEIRGFNTNTKAPIGETWVDGTVLWNNPAVAGGFTSVEPQAPNLKIPVAIVISAGNNGVIFVRPRLGMRLTDLHDVDAFTPSDKDLISYDSALGHWNAKSLGSVIGGTSSQFLKGDGSLDSNAYALASQINIASGQVAFGTGSGVIGGDSGLTWDNTSKFLQVRGDISTSGFKLVSKLNAGSNSNNSGAQIILASSTGTTGLSIYGGRTNASGGGGISVNSLTGGITKRVFYTDSNGDLIYFFTNDIERARFISTGEFGLNTTSPTNTLDVNGTARIRTINNATGDFVTASATGVLQKRTASETLADIGGIGGSGTTNYIPKFTASGTIGNSTIYENGGNVGIGTTNPLNATNFVCLTLGDNSASKIGLLQLRSSYNSGNGAQLYQNTSGDIFFNINSTTVGFNVKSSGNLLIGTITDSGQKLQVSGDAYVSGNVGIATTSPTNTLDVNGTARIRSLTGTTGYLPLLSSTGVMGQSVVYNTSAGSILIGTINEVSGHKVRISGGALNITNWQSSAGAYDKLSIDFGENRGFGYDPTPNEIFVKGSSTVPVKIDTDAPTDSLNVLSTGGIKMANIPSGTIVNAVGLDSNNELVKISSFSSYKLLDEDITPTAFTSGTFATLLTGGILGTNSFDGATDASYEGEIWIRSVDDAISNFDLRLSIWGQNLDVNIVLGSGSQTWNTFVRFRLIIQSGNFLLTGQTVTMLENTNFEYVKNINHSNTTYTASSTSSIDVQARCLGTGSPTLYMTSFVLKQIA